MAEIVKMPKLGFDMAEGTLIRWAVAEGQKVQKGELLAEIETDKATVEVESQYSGVVHHHLISEGGIVPVSEPIAVIGEKGEDIDLDSLVGAASSKEEQAIKAEETSAAAGTSAEPMPRLHAPIPESAPAKIAAGTANGQLPKGLRASPLARRIAAEQNLDLAAIKGSGPKGRIVRKDVESLAASGEAVRSNGLAGLAPLGAVDIGAAKADERVPMSRLRAAIGRRMTHARQEIPHFYVTHEYDTQPVLDARKQANAVLKATGEKLSVNDFVIKAAALALRQFPNLNASLDGEAVLHHGRVNVGVAVAVENGLLVVVSKDADRKTIRQISSEVRVMAERARSGNVHAEDIEGSTFSVSNLGMFDVAHFVAIINPPEAAILALGSARQVPVVEDGQVKVGSRMQATLSVDHRVSDGAEAAQFLQILGQYLENPAALLLQ